MAEYSSEHSSSSIDPMTGFCNKNKSFHSLRPPVPLPSPTLPLSFPAFALSLLPSPLPSDPALIDATTDTSLSYPSLISQLHSLAFSLKTHLHLSKGDVAFILSPPRLDIPILYLSLLSIGVIVCPSNPLSTPQEISRQLSLVNPSVIFTTAATAHKFDPAPSAAKLRVIIQLDSPEFKSFLLHTPTTTSSSSLSETVIYQSDTAAIQFSSGTTGLFKAAALPHRGFIAMLAGFHALSRPRNINDIPGTSTVVNILVPPMFHSFGFFFALKGVALGETTVLMGRMGLGDILGAAERFGATDMTVAPPMVAAMGTLTEEVERFDLRKLERVVTGAAPVTEAMAERFAKQFPRVELRQVSFFVFKHI